MEIEDICGAVTVCKLRPAGVQEDAEAEELGLPLLCTGTNGRAAAVAAERLTTLERRTASATVEMAPEVGIAEDGDPQPPEGA